jgi:hypothetical protein
MDSPPPAQGGRYILGRLDDPMDTRMGSIETQ